MPLRPLRGRERLDDRVHHFSVFREAVRVFFVPHGHAVHDDGEDAARTFDELRLMSEFVRDFGRRTGGLRVEVSLSAVGDRDVHRRIRRLRIMVRRVRRAVRRTSALSKGVPTRRGAARCASRAPRVAFLDLRGCNSAGRVAASQAACRGFESLHPLSHEGRFARPSTLFMGLRSIAPRRRAARSLKKVRRCATL